jgi:hypothetical protein
MSGLFLSDGGSESTKPEFPDRSRKVKGPAQNNSFTLKQPDKSINLSRL